MGQFIWGLVVLKSSFEQCFVLWSKRCLKPDVIPT